MFYVDTAKKHDLTVLKERKEDFAGRVEGGVIIADKGYISKDFAEEMEKRSVRFVAVKRGNMIKSDEEAKYYRFLSKLKKKIETLFSVADNFGLKFIKAVSEEVWLLKSSSHYSPLTSIS